LFAALWRFREPVIPNRDTNGAATHRSILRLDARAFSELA
jgi:hypothetical protein